MHMGMSPAKVKPSTKTHAKQFAMDKHKAGGRGAIGRNRHARAQ